MTSHRIVNAKGDHQSAKAQGRDAAFGALEHRNKIGHVVDFDLIHRISPKHRESGSISANVPIRRRLFLREAVVLDDESWGAGGKLIGGFGVSFERNGAPVGRSGKGGPLMPAVLEFSDCASTKSEGD